MWRYTAIDKNGKTIHVRAVATAGLINEARAEVIQRAVAADGKAYCQDDNGNFYQLFPLR